MEKEVFHQKSLEKAGKEYDQFNKTQKVISDFDKPIKQLKNKGK
ncbi:hypothetical protein WG904_13925 [Pedobacter sp. Du54]